MADTLTLLKKAIAGEATISVLKDGSATESFVGATHALIDKTQLALSTPTSYQHDSKAATLGQVLFAWLHKDLSRTQFIELSEAQGVESLGFLQRSDLTSWLAGDKQEFEFGQASEPVVTDEKVVDPVTVDVLAKERSLVDHNTSLRGIKLVDFSSVADSCKRLYLQEKKRPTSSTTSAGSGEKRHKRKVNPIILVSPSASSVLTMANLKHFLEKGVYINPTTTDPLEQELLNTTDLSMVTHEFPKIGKLTFMCVNNTDKFNKEEHWDRAVAVFTTGQKWQFKNYKWSKPEELFQKVKGYYFHFEREQLPQSCKEWNVETIALDRNKRFKDAVVLNAFWDSLERALLAKGY